MKFKKIYTSHRVIGGGRPPNTIIGGGSAPCPPPPLAPPMVNQAAFRTLGISKISRSMATGNRVWSGVDIVCMTSRSGQTIVRLHQGNITGKGWATAAGCTPETQCVHLRPGMHTWDQVGLHLRPCMHTWDQVHLRPGTPETRCAHMIPGRPTPETRYVHLRPGMHT